MRPVVSLRRAHDPASRSYFYPPGRGPRFACRAAPTTGTVKQGPLAATIGEGLGRQWQWPRRLHRRSVVGGGSSGGSRSGGGSHRRTVRRDSKGGGNTRRRELTGTGSRGKGERGHPSSDGHRGHRETTRAATRAEQAALVPRGSTARQVPPLRSLS